MLKTELDGLKPLMLQSLPWTPHDFIRNISPEGDRRVHIEPFVRELEPSNDLRIKCSIGLIDVAVCAERLPWDSAFFGYNVARLDGILPLRVGGYDLHADYTPAVRALRDLASRRDIKYLFAVIDSRDLPTIRALTTAGFALLETRCTFWRSLRDYGHPRRYRCRPATEADVPSLCRIAREVVNPYDRFASDPFITRDELARLMETWVRASVLQGFADAVFVPDQANPKAVMMVRYQRDKWAAWQTSIAQVTFSLAPRPAQSSVRLLTEISFHLKDMDVAYVYLTTQIANRSVIRPAERLGFQLGRSEYVFRLIL